MSNFMARLTFCLIVCVASCCKHRAAVNSEINNEANEKTTKRQNEHAMHDSICDVFVVRVSSIAMRCLCLCLCMRVRAREWKNTKSTLAHTYSHKQRKIEMIHRTFEHFLLFVVKLANDDNKGSTSADFIFAISIDNLLQVNLKLSSIRPTFLKL